MKEGRREPSSPLQAQKEAESRGSLTKTFCGPLMCAEHSQVGRGEHGVLTLEMVMTRSLARRVWRTLQFRGRRGARKGAAEGMSNPGGADGFRWRGQSALSWGELSRCHGQSEGAEPADDSPGIREMGLLGAEGAGKAFTLHTPGTSSLRLP